MNNNILKKIISSARKQKGYNKTQLAEKSGISITYISRIEKGERTSLSVRVLQQLCNALDLDLNSVLKQIEKNDVEILDVPPNKTFKEIEKKVQNSNNYKLKVKINNQIEQINNTSNLEIILNLVSQILANEQTIANNNIRTAL